MPAKEYKLSAVMALAGGQRRRSIQYVSVVLFFNSKYHSQKATHELRAFPDHDFHKTTLRINQHLRHQMPTTMIAIATSTTKMGDGKKQVSRIPTPRNIAARGMNPGRLNINITPFSIVGNSMKEHIHNSA